MANGSKGGIKAVRHKIPFLTMRALAYVIANPRKTARELSVIAGDTDPATIRRRLSELEEPKPKSEFASLGPLIKANGRRQCEVSGFKATEYVPLLGNITEAVFRAMETHLGKEPTDKIRAAVEKTRQSA